MAVARIASLAFIAAGCIIGAKAGHDMAACETISVESPQIAPSRPCSNQEEGKGPKEVGGAVLLCLAATVLFHFPRRTAEPS